MGSARVDLFCEDAGHEQFVRAMVKRLSREANQPIFLTTRCASGGRGSAIAQFKAFQRTLRHLQEPSPDLLVVVIDTNCSAWHEVHRNIQDNVVTQVVPRVVVGCPDPHVERWCLADPSSFQQVIGHPPPADPAKCERDVYKRLLADAIRAAGQIILTGPMEYAPELVEAMDWYRAGKSQPSLRHFVEDLRSAMKSLAG